MFLQKLWALCLGPQFPTQIEPWIWRPTEKRFKTQVSAVNSALGPWISGEVVSLNWFSALPHIWLWTCCFMVLALSVDVKMKQKMRKIIRKTVRGRSILELCFFKRIGVPWAARDDRGDLEGLGFKGLVRYNNQNRVIQLTSSSKSHFVQNSSNHKHRHPKTTGFGDDVIWPPTSPTPSILYPSPPPKMSMGGGREGDGSTGGQERRRREGLEGRQGGEERTIWSLCCDIQMHDENKKRLEPKTVRRPHFFSPPLGAHKNDSGFLGVGLGVSFFEGLFFE